MPGCRAVALGPPPAGDRGLAATTDDSTPPGADPLLTIGDLARATGPTVRTIRCWSDEGLLPPVDRSVGGHRLRDAASAARPELIHTLRELGLGLDDVRRVVAGETTVAEVAARHVAALDARIRALRVTRAVLSTVADRGSTAGGTTLMNVPARLSAAERARIAEEFVEKTFRGPDTADPEFRARTRAAAEFNAADRDGSTQAGASMWFVRRLVRLASEARARGVSPESPEAGDVLRELLGDDADHAAVPARMEADTTDRLSRCRELPAVVKGRRPDAGHREELARVVAALCSRAAG